MDADAVKSDVFKKSTVCSVIPWHWSRLKERGIELLLFLTALTSVAITVGIVGVLVYESVAFFRHVSLIEFLTDPQWTPLFSEPH